MDAILLARLQFFITVAFHFIFPAITIGLGLVIAVVETLRWRTHREIYDRMATFWTRLFALTFVVGVATGIVMEFQFGTNWSRYSTFVGDIFGSPLAAEGVIAFFLESSFLGILIFGRHRVSSTVRWLSAVLVAVGSTLSAFWIIVANSWMQTPAGYEVQGDKAVLTDFFAAVFNPSTLPRFMHTVAACWAVGSFVVVGIAAWYLLRGRGRDVASGSLRIGLALAVVASVLMFVTGDTHARQVATTQPAKFAAMQGLYSTTEGAPLIVFSLPPNADGTGSAGPELLVTRLLSFLAYGDFNASVTGLEEFPTADWPPLVMTFLTYHNMVLLGTVMLLVMLGGLWLWTRGRLDQSRRWLWLAVIATPAPLLAVQLGWATAEVGRQPWIVQGLMRTLDATSPVVSAPEILASIILFSLLYVALGALWLFLMRREVLHGPAPAPAGVEEPAATGITQRAPMEEPIHA
ncbi:MAG TPA: cytochrome ubiquinol oxidase subunit I [Candidatus Limnocylindria bacterium]